jgi:D-glycero-D-manno-heptose 1,7-bisphosphate phosphatase
MMINSETHKLSAVFLDRDGVINKRIPDAYVTCPEQFEFLPGAKDAIKTLSHQFKYVIIVTNQQGIGRKLMSGKQLDEIHSFLISQVNAHGGRIDKIYHCPHHKSEQCNCRKPKTGMFIEAMNDFPDIDPQMSVMIGDTISDMIFGKSSGLTTILITQDILTDKDILKYTDQQFGSLFEMSKQFL